MNLTTIRETIGNFSKHLSAQRLCDIDWLYEKQSLLCPYDTLNADNIEGWAQLLFTSDHTQRYWQRPNHRPAELLKALIKFDADMVSTAFRDLFDEQRDLEGRVDRFKFYMEEIIQRIRRNSRSFIESWHHQDNSIISFYLMIQFPNDYIYYTRSLHENAVTKLGAKPLKAEEDFVRYQKMAKTLHQFIIKDEKLISVHQSRFPQYDYGQSRLLVYEYLSFI